MMMLHGGYQQSMVKPLAVTCSAIFACLSLAVAADDQAVLEKQGGALLEKYCARCHAVGRVGRSAHPGAPEFRTLAHRYPIEELEEALGEGILSGHPHMPEFRFRADDVGAIIAYLKSIQVP
jgi:mono/diheme cytochrome c family protein